MKIQQIDRLLEPDGIRLKTFRTPLQFIKSFKTDEDCIKYILSLKFEDGWTCLECGSENYCLKSRRRIKCMDCGYEESFISDTAMRKTRKPLNEWFWAIYNLATNKSGMSAMELYRQLDFGSYQTAWTWLQKIRMAMVNPERKKLEGKIEIDETYLFKGAKGRALDEGLKLLIICAVEKRKSKKGKLISGRARLKNIPSANRININNFVKSHIKKKSTLYTDGWRGYTDLKKIGYKHIVKVIEDKKLVGREFPLVHRVFANLKAWVKGTHRFISQKHIQNYLNEFTFRYNRRHKPYLAFNTLLKLIVSHPQRTYEEFTEPRKLVYADGKVDLYE
jgi:transposase-like protein